MRHPAITPEEELTLQERIAGRIVSGMGSWKFIIWQAIIMVVWGAWNILAPPSLRFDAPPFIMLNLALSTEAAFAAPLILIAQRRSDQMMRDLAEHDHALLKDLHDTIRS